MQPGLKLTIGLISAGFLLTASGIAFGVYWWTTHKDPFLASGKAMIQAGANFGRTVDQQACWDSALVRHRADNSVGATIWTSLYVRGCLQASRVTPGFCRTIPSPSDTLRTVHWRLEQCEQAKFVDNNCHHIFGAIQQSCHSHR